MLAIFVCEDNNKTLDKIANYVESHIKSTRVNAKIACTTPNPSELITYLQNNKVSGLYFLDLDLKSSIDGFGLAIEIRKYDPRAFIVIITNDKNSKPLVFEFVIEVMDYITKDSPDIGKRIQNCINIAHGRYIDHQLHKNKKLEVRLSQDSICADGIRYYKGDTMYLDIEDILYLETTPGKAHQITFHCINGEYTKRWDLGEAQQALGEKFIRCHRSTVVNIEKILGYSSKKRAITLINGRELDMGRTYNAQVVQGMKLLAENI